MSAQNRWRPNRGRGLFVAFAGLVIVCLATAWSFLKVSLEQAFVVDYIDIFLKVENDVLSGTLTDEEGRDYLRSYYPAGTKLEEGTPTSVAVEKLRVHFISKIESTGDT